MKKDSSAPRSSQEQAFNNDTKTPPNFVFADYVLALAVIESGMTNLGAKPTTSDAVGPLQITSAQWKDFVDQRQAVL